ncbi:MAG TPA: hypothetical protein PKN19_03190, partial [Rectinema sp.]|nr:hypothetical protein [Rectinema sp.]
LLAYLINLRNHQALSPKLSPKLAKAHQSLKASKVQIRTWRSERERNQRTKFKKRLKPPSP